MKCPACNNDIGVDALSCKSCGLYAPRAELFINNETFSVWKKDIDIIKIDIANKNSANKNRKPTTSLNTKESIILKKTSGSMPKVYSNHYGSYNNPIRLFCSESQIVDGCRWDKFSIDGNLVVDLILQSNMATFGDLFYFTYNHTNYFFRIDEKIIQPELVFIDGSQVYGPYYLKYSESSKPQIRPNLRKGACCNPIMLFCTKQQLKDGHTWDKYRLNDNTFLKLVLPANVAHFGNIFYFCFRGMNYYCCIEEQKYNPDNLVGTYVLQLSSVANQPYIRFYPKGSLNNPVVLQCTSSQIKSGYRWSNYRINDRKTINLVLPGNTAKKNSLMFCRIDNDDYYFLIEEKREVHNTGGVSSTGNKTSVNGKAIKRVGPFFLQKSNKTVVSFNTSYPKGSMKNPLILYCKASQLKAVCSWEHYRYSNLLEFKLILPARTAAFGDLLFFRYESKDFYCLLKCSVS